MGTPGRVGGNLGVFSERVLLEFQRVFVGIAQGFLKGSSRYKGFRRAFVEIRGSVSQPVS